MKIKALTTIIYSGDKGLTTAARDSVFDVSDAVGEDLVARKAALAVEAKAEAPKKKEKPAPKKAAEKPAEKAETEAPAETKKDDAE